MDSEQVLQERVMNGSGTWADQKDEVKKAVEEVANKSVEEFEEELNRIVRLSNR